MLKWLVTGKEGVNNEKQSTKSTEDPLAIISGYKEANYGLFTVNRLSIIIISCCHCQVSLMSHED